MKIIYLHQYFNTPSMPGGTRSYEMARRLVAAGHEVHMVTSWRSDAVVNPDHKPAWFASIEQGIQVHWYPVPYSNHMSYFRRINAFFDFAVAAKKKANELQGDVVFATSTPLTIALPAVLSARKHKVPMVFEVRDLWPELPIAIGALKNPLIRFLAKQLERWAYRNAAAIVALSPGMKAGVVDSGYPSARVAVIPNSSDNQEFEYNAAAAAQFRAARPWLGARPLLVYTGTLGRINGVGYLVDLAQALQTRAPDVRILVIGDGLERAEVIARAQAQGVFEHNIFFETKVPKQDIPALLSAATMAASVFIDLPEMQANSANKFFDALASATPILINYGGWQHHLISANGCGLALWRQPIEQVAQIVAEKIQDADWLAQAGAAARELAERVFDRDVLAAQLEQVLKAAVNGQPDSVVSIASGQYA